MSETKDCRTQLLQPKYFQKPEALLPMFQLVILTEA